MVDGYRPRDELVYVMNSTRSRQLDRFALRGDRTMFLFIFRAEHPSTWSTGVAPKDHPRNAFRDVGWESQNILATLDDVDAADRISLLGGEGTGLAITEAYVPAGELALAGVDYRRAFDAYEARLRPFIQAKQAGETKSIDAHDELQTAGNVFRRQCAR